MVILPGAYMLSDYAENLSIITMVLSYPSRIDTAAAIGETLRTAKTITSTTAVLLILTTLLWWLRPWIRRIKTG